MQKKETAIEVKVGALVLFSIALLVAFVIILGDFSFDDGFVIYVDYDNAGGLKPGADVAISGIKAGKVERLDFLGGTMDKETGREVMVRAKVVLDPAMASAVRQDSEFYVTTQGVLGEKYIEVLTRNLKAPAVAEDAKLRGVDPPRLEILLARASGVLEEIADLLSRDDIPIADLIRNTNSLFMHADEVLLENRDSLKQVMSNIEVVTSDAKDLTAVAKTALGDGSDIQASLRSVRSLTAKLDRDIEPITRRTIRTLDNAEAISETVKDLTVTQRPKIEGAIDNLHVTSQNARKVSDDISGISDDIKAGKGTIGGLVKDEEIYDDLKEMLRELKRRPWKIIWKE